MSRKIKAVQYGVGAMGRVMIEMMRDKGIEIVGGIGRPTSAIIGQDLGTLAGIGPLGVFVTGDAEKTLTETKPDIAVVCITTYLADLWPHVELCARLGVNVVTIAEECFYPWRTEPELSRRWDALCKQNHCSAYGIGYQDFYWGNQITQLAGTCHSITSVSGFAQFNVDDYGPEVARDHMVGLTADVFAVERKKKGDRPSYMQMVGDLIIDGLGLTFKSVTEDVYQTTASQEIFCKSLNIALPKGIGTGNANRTHFETAEGIPVDIEMVSKVYEPGETDQNKWEIKGRPNVNVSNERPATDVLTCTEVVSRIPDVISAPAGLLKAFEMPPIKYRRRFD
jgi:4-hydroxy-tetrahydrodipicolinate reductase